MQEVRSAQREKLLQDLTEGQVRKGRVTSIRNFGAFVDLGGADGLVHLSELSWNRVEDPTEIVRVGQEVEVYVMSVDQETKRIALSLRRAQPEPWDEIADKFYIGQLVTGTITKLVNFGAFARLDGPVEGLIHVSELTDRHIMHPKEVVGEGDVLTLKIVRIEPDRHRLALSLKQAQDELGADYDNYLKTSTTQREAEEVAVASEADA
jgi:small subunit ribosomal protein S1